MAAILSEEVASLFDLPIERLDLFWRDRIDRIAGGLTQEGADGLLAEFLAQTWDSLKEFEIEASERTMGPVRLGFLRTGGRSEEKKRVPVYLRGKIDRIDKASGMTRIIDYKTGPHPTSGALHGWGFQLPLYALLLMKDEPTREVEACFYSIRLPLEVKQLFLAARIANGTRTLAPFVRYYRRKALRTVSCLYQGRFPFTVLPRSRAGCSSCPFRQICRYDPVKSASILDRKLFPGQELLVEHGKWIGPTDQRNSPGPNPSSPTERCSEN